ncbi:MAG: hypothetical protein GY845_01640 [Planctomycetes bacterium]|nr:hypothetical protein [Planctomycetota bacterium]
MSWNLFEKILSVFNPQDETNQPSESSEQWPESSTEDSWQEGVSEQSEASQEPSPVSTQTSCSLQSEDDDQSDDSDQPKNNSDWQQE